MKAYQVLEKYGWIQKTFGNRDYGFCLAGAITEAYPKDKDSNKAFNKLVKLHPRRFADGVVVTWNDNPGRTKKQVVELLKKANI